MRKVIYQGRETNLSGHGHVRAGDTLELTECEWDYVVRDGNPDFEPVAEGERPRPRTVIKPLAGPLFDLTKVPWQNPKVVTGFMSTGTAELQKIAGAMCAQRVRVEFDRQTAREVLADRIIVAARRAGWIPEAVPGAVRPTDESPAPNTTLPTREEDAERVKDLEAAQARDARLLSDGHEPVFSREDHSKPVSE